MATTPEPWAPAQFSEHVPQQIRRGIEYSGNHFRSSLIVNKNSTSRTSDAELQRAGNNIYTRIANAHFSQEKADENHFNNWISCLHAGAKYSENWDRVKIDAAISRITKELGMEKEEKGSFIIGMAAQCLVGSNANALGNFLTDEMIQNDPLVVPALTALRDELIALESGPLIHNKPSPMIEKEVALHGVLMPDAWKHMHNRGTKFMVSQGSEFVMKPAMPEVEETQRGVLVQTALDALMEHDVLPKSQPEPGSTETIRGETENLGNVEWGFVHGERHDLKKNGREINTLAFMDLFNKRTQDGQPAIELVVPELKKITESERGQTSFLVGAFMRALVRGEDKNYFTATEIASRFKEPPEKKQLIESVIKNFDTKLGMIFESNTNNKDYVRIKRNLQKCSHLIGEKTIQIQVGAS